MTKLTTERLEYYAVLPTKPAERKAIFMYEVRCMARQLLAYEQAAEHPAARITWDGSEFSVSNVSEDFLYGGTAVYLAPVLPKQPESRNEIMAKGVEAFAKDWKGSARYSRISEMACNFAAKLRNGDADEC
ncbi:MAG: hypothetical protein ACTID2_18780 [Hafnia alvei]|uniref:hypothetical protein n=1 Tax=Hafnia alvei TaxID=569 RepID=UPI003F906D1B